MKETDQLRKLMESVSYGTGDRRTLVKEYFNQGGDPLSGAVMNANVFTDTIGDEPITSMDMDDDDPQWSKSPELRAIVEKYGRIAHELLQKAKAKDRPLTDEEAQAADAAVYDGSDAYYSLEDALHFLPEIYDEQIEILNGLIDGTLDLDDYTW